MTRARLVFSSTRLAALLVAVFVAVPLSAQDALDAIVNSTGSDEQVLLEQLKTAKALMTAELWRPLKDPRQPGAQERDPEREAKAQEQGIASLDEVEALPTLSDALRLELYQLRQLQYSKIRSDSVQYENYTQKLIKIPSCPPDIVKRAESQMADLGSPWSVLDAYYVACLPEELINRRKGVFEAYALKQMAATDFIKNPGIAGMYNALGQTYWADGQNDKAEQLFLEVMKQKDVAGSKVAGGHIGDAMMFLASIELRRGNREKALQYCKDLLAKNYPNIGLSPGRGNWYSIPATHAAKAVRYWKDDYTPDLDNLKLPYFTDCKPYPSPQEPEYTDQYVQLKSVRIEGGADFPKDHPLFRLIGVKFKRYGIGISGEAPFTIRINTAKHPKTPDKPQGYYLEIADKEAVISGNDYLGTVWGVVSFIQCVDGKTGRARVCKIRDWPATLRRGNSGYGDNLIEFGLFNKLNYFFNQTYCFTDAGLPDKEVIYENLKYMAKPFSDFGLDFYVADRTPMFPKLCLTNDRTLQYHLNRHLKLASYGANISMILDDSRYPLNPIDAKVDGGHGWKIDNEYVQKLYATVKAKYPKVKMVFCPTYYWGPHWKDAYTDDSRADYFKGIRTYLDPAIEVFWSGNQVLGHVKTREQVKWFRESAGRKPMVWQNGMGPHIRMNYGCEVIDWTSWHYPGFFENDCEGYMANADFPATAFALGHMADALWRPEVYRAASTNREFSLKRATDQLCGEGVYDALRPGTRTLNYMDRYLWGNGMTLNQNLFEENPDELKEMIATAENAMKQAIALNPVAARYSCHYSIPVGTMKGLLAQYDNPKSFYDLPEYKAGLGENFKAAKKEAALNEDKDVFGNAFDFHIGKPVVLGGRTCVQYFPKSPSRKGVWKFDVPEFPENYELSVCGRLAQEGDAKPTLRVTLNETNLYEGPADFTTNAWTFMKFAVTWEAITEKGNALTIENISPREKGVPPLTYYIGYAMVKPSASKGDAKKGDAEKDDGPSSDDLLKW